MGLGYKYLFYVPFLTSIFSVTTFCLFDPNGKVSESDTVYNQINPYGYSGKFSITNLYPALILICLEQNK